jgi:hypothetical protein
MEGKEGLLLYSDKKDINLSRVNFLIDKTQRLQMERIIKD